MNEYNFSKKYVSENGIISYEQIGLDNKVKRYHYLPYLDHLDKDLVDKYNKFILKRRFGYHIDQNNPNNYMNDNYRLINDNEIIENIKNEYKNLIEFSSNLTNNFNDAIDKIDYYKTDVYYAYRYICEINLYFEIQRLYSILVRFQNYNNKSKLKTYNIKHLFLIMFILYFIFLLFYNIFN